ncbi:hypothetical protein IAT38_004594 [Cryptococcus sp. DSM 104549]
MSYQHPKRGNPQTTHVVTQLLTPPLTPESSIAFQQPTSTTPTRFTAMSSEAKIDGSSPTSSPEFALPPSIAQPIPTLDLDAPSLPSEDVHVDLRHASDARRDLADLANEKDAERYAWREGMSEEERDKREAWLAAGRGRKGLRIVIVTENFLPKVDGVTRTLSRLLEHLHASGHQCMLLGPSSSLTHYASHPLVGTLGIPLVVYPGLKLNFLRPKFLRVIKEWQPDVVHFVDPIWLGAQTLLAMELGWAGEEWVGEEGPALGAGIGGAVVASYHTNLATYATLFGLSYLTPIIWRFQHFLYSKTLLTLCPSPSTKAMLESQSFDGVRLWPRGVNLEQFGPRKRSVARRAEWGVGEAPGGSIGTPGAGAGVKVVGMTWGGGKVDELMTPPMSPENGPVKDMRVPMPGAEAFAPSPASPAAALPERVVLLYVGRISWEKNLRLLLAAYAHLPALLYPGQPTSANPALLPKLIFVGDGPARSELEGRCKKEGWDAEFLGHREGADLAECYASGDVFAFPSFTETFGQVVLEALSSGLPVVGLDAEGTRDLVSHASTGLLLSLPSSNTNPAPTWATVCQPESPYFPALAEGYAAHLARVVQDAELRKAMGKKGSTDGIEGYTWWDAMEKCVDGYRESMRTARAKRSLSIVPHSPFTENAGIPIPPASTGASHARKVSTVNRVVSRRLAHKGYASPAQGLNESRSGWRRKRGDEGAWILKTALKAMIALALVYAIYTHRRAKLTGISFEELEVMDS